MEQGQNPNCYILNDRAYVLIDTPTMSFPPPGPPMPMPGMPPVPPIIPPPPYAVPPMGGMIPMTVGMMPAPMMAPVPMTVPTAIPMPAHQKLHIKKISHIPYRKHVEIDNHSIPRGPPVTVFVGNITERASDSLVRQLLQRCGTVVNWKRVQGANGRLQAFGFCEYGDPESALRAIRLLHDWQLGERKLVVKVDAKTKEKLDEYKATKWAKQQETGETKNETKEGEEEEKKSEEKPQQSEDALDEATKQKDMSIKSSIETLLRMHAGELNKPVETKEVPITLPPPPPFLDKVKKVSKPQEGSKPSHDIDKDSRNDLDEMDLDVEKKSLIHREIDKFRDTYKRAEEEREKEKEKERKSKKRDHDSPDSRDRDRSERRRSRERNLSRSREERRRRSRERERDRKPLLRESPARRERDYRERSRERNDRSRSRSREREREWSRERDYSAERLTVTRSRDTRDKDWEKEEEEVEEAYERKKMQNKLKEKEAAYQERLKNWVLRERRQAKEYEKVRLKAEEQKRDEIKEARRLKEFLEDYDDERDDPKYFKGSALVRRLKEREKEIEADNYDRQKEKEELEELRRKLAEEGHPDPEAEVKKMLRNTSALLQEETRLLQPKLKPETPDSDHEVDIQQQHEAKMKPITKQASPHAEPEETKPAKQPVEDENTQNSFSGFSDIITTHEEAKPMGFASLRLGGSPTQQFTTPSTSQVTTVAQSGQKRKITLDEVFSANDDEEAEQKKKRKLIPLDDTQEETKSSSGIAQMTTEEKRKHIKNLIDKIPTAKNELFAYNLDWSVVDKSLMERRIRPWINKKIVEYIGEEEPTLVDFICSKVLAGSSAQSILDDVSMVLDEEAEVFVVKMWRLLIYEIEAKKLGLVR